MQMPVLRPVRQRPLIGAQAGLLVLLALCAWWLLAAPAASAADYSWSGEGSPTDKLVRRG
jgi:hypothetical protein